MTRYFFYAFLVAAGANFICSLKILRDLAEAGISIGRFEMRWQVHKHLKTYQQLTRQRDGRVAPPFYAYWATLIGMALFGFLTLFTL